MESLVQAYVVWYTEDLVPQESCLPRVSSALKCLSGENRFNNATILTPISDNGQSKRSIRQQTKVGISRKILMIAE